MWWWLVDFRCLTMFLFTTTYHHHHPLLSFSPSKSWHFTTGRYHTGQKDRLGWIPPSRIVTLHPWGVEGCSTCVDGGTFNVAAHDMGVLDAKETDVRL